VTTAVIKAFLEHVEKENLKPLWCCADERTEEILGEEPFNWSVLECAAEDRIDVAETDPMSDKAARRKIHHAEREGIDVVEENEPSDDLRKQVDEGLASWKKNRKGVQVHTTPLTPWRDVAHRRYFYAKDKDGKVLTVLRAESVHSLRTISTYSVSPPLQIDGLVVLAQIEGGAYAIKWAIQFPDTPVGVSEILIAKVIDKLKEEGNTDLTFGIGASKKLEPVANLSGWKIRWLSKTYEGIVTSMGLAKKPAFRRKFQAKEDPVYVCYPQDSLGMKGVNAASYPLLLPLPPPYADDGPFIQLMHVLKAPK
jgi:hypothetical protein